MTTYEFECPICVLQKQKGVLKAALMDWCFKNGPVRYDRGRPYFDPRDPITGSGRLEGACDNGHSVSLEFRSSERR